MLLPRARRGSAMRFLHPPSYCGCGCYVWMCRPIWSVTECRRWCNISITGVFRHCPGSALRLHKSLFKACPRQGGMRQWMLRRGGLRSIGGLPSRYSSLRPQSAPALSSSLRMSTGSYKSLRLRPASFLPTGNCVRK